MRRVACATATTAGSQARQHREGGGRARHEALAQYDGTHLPRSVKILDPNEAGLCLASPSSERGVDAAANTIVHHGGRLRVRKLARALRLRLFLVFEFRAD